jgi:hypothetical protein
MPIRPARNPDDKQATANTVAALILMAWAELRLTRTVDPKTLVAEWQKIKDELPFP